MRALSGSGNVSTLVQFEWQIKRRMDIRLAYKYSEPWLDRPEGRIQTPYVSRHRGLLGWFYETRDLWGFDLALQWRGAQRVVLPQEASEVEFSPGFAVVNAQIKKRIGNRWEAYVGAENLLDFVQKQPILSPEAPYESGFDATLIWGPVMGRIVFVGVNWQLKSSRGGADQP
jgi:outer membrane receptor protein involved in Fe transport